MKVAIPATTNGIDGKVSEHFGKAPKFVVAEISGHELINAKLIDNPFASEHSPGDLPRFLKELGIDILVCCRVGKKAKDYFRDLGIEVIDGLCGPVTDAMEKSVLHKFKE